MRRREVIALLTSATAWSGLARAQQPERVRRIGVLLGIAENDPEAQARVTALQEGLAALGWGAGRNITMDVRFGTGDAERIRTYASELVGLAPDVIVANSSPVVTALKEATSTIPIVFAVVNDPVGQGFIANLSSPSGNITGFTFIDFQMIGKWVDLLRELSPPVTRSALLFGAATSPYYHSYLRALESERGTRTISAVPVHTASDVEPTVASLAGTKGTGLIAPADAFNVVHRKTIIAAAKRHSVPAVYTYRQFVIEDGLMSYGPDTTDIFRRSADYIDRILRGAKPGDLPAQAPNKFEFVINLKTAHAIGVTVPLTLLARADEVIE
jgi:putative tryptophan/tyrosine transport system substrate-binding protein